MVGKVGKIIVLALRSALSLIFLKAGILKIWDFDHWRSATPEFTLAIQHYHILPWPDLTMLLAIYLPWLEVITAVALWIRPLRMGAATVLTGLTVIFIGALGSAWARGLEISCGCFGKDEFSTDFRALMLRDLCILGALAILLSLEWMRLRSPDSTKKSRLNGAPGTGDF